MTRTTNEVLRALRQQQQVLGREIQALEIEQRETRSALNQVGDEVEAAWTHLSNALVPSLDAPALDATAHRIRLREVSAAGLERRMADERARIEAELRGVEADPRFKDREALRNEAAIRLHELEDALDQLEAGLKELEREPLFRELVASGYDSEAYTGSFWQLSYYRHWKHADLILEKHGARLRVQTFGELRTKYQSEASAAAALRRNQGEWRTKVKALDELEAHHAQRTDDLRTLMPRTLTWARGRVREHLGSLDRHELQRLLTSDEELRVALARVLGADAKRTYLEELLANAITPPLGDLKAALDKARRDANKFNRPKGIGRMFSDDEYQRRFGKDRSANWTKRRTRIRDARTHIVSFHDYDRWSPSRDFLWWDVMSDGRLDGNFISEVQERGPRYAQDHAAVASVSACDDISLDFS